MPNRLPSLLVLIGLLLGVVLMPVTARASTHEPRHSSDMVDIWVKSEAEHPAPQPDKNMPCEASSHHHCSVALQLDGPRIALASVARSALIRPASTAPLRSHTRAPPIDPPTA